MSASSEVPGNTKEVEVWRVDYAARSAAFGKWLCLNHTFSGPDAERHARADAERMAGEDGVACIRVTSHKQEVPA